MSDEEGLDNSRGDSSPITHSSLIPHHSSLIPHHSSLITHPSSLIPHHSSLITHPSSLTPPLSSLIPLPSSHIPHHVPLARVVLLTFVCSLVDVPLAIPCDHGLRAPGVAC